MATVTIIPASSTPATSNSLSNSTSLSTSSSPQLRVAAYCRVSTDESEQLNSFSVQINYYTDLIKSQQNWQLAGIFADEGISGTQMENRTQFNKMRALAKQRRIDLILCKSVSRFARNTVECLECIRELKKLNVAVQFEKENINTMSASTEFAITLYASFAQAESESISRNITWGIERSYREGRFSYHMSQTLGYRLVNGTPTIVEEEAQIVRQVFKMYADGVSMYRIAQIMTDRGAVRRNGSSKWNRENVRAILRNEKYSGDAILQKTYTTDCLTHSRARNDGAKPKYLVTNCHPAIVDRATYDKVRAKLSNIASSNSPRPQYLLTRLLRCSICGASYGRVIWRSGDSNIAVWRCHTTLNGGKSACPAPTIREQDLHNAITGAVNRYIANNTPDITRVNECKARLAELDKELDSITLQLARIASESNKLLTQISVMDSEYVGNRLKELQEAESKIRLEESRIVDEQKCIRNELGSLNNCDDLLSGVEQLEMFDESIIEMLVSRVLVINSDVIEISLKSEEKIVTKVLGTKSH